MSTADTVLPILLAGGQGSRLFDLTERECKPAIPFVAGRRIVDWTMQNVVSSGLSRLAVATQYCPSTLEYHLRNAWAGAFSPFALSIFRGPRVTGAPAGFVGTADAVTKTLPRVVKPEDTEVLVLSADHIYQMDYQEMIEAHRASGAKVTLAACAAPLAEARGFGVIAADAGGRITGFQEKPHDPRPMIGCPDKALVSMGIYVFDRHWLERALQKDAANPLSKNDFGHDILPLAVSAGQAGVYLPPSEERPFYWRDVGTLDAYRAAALDFAGGNLPCDLPRVATKAGQPRPAATVRDFVRGDCVVMPGALVELGAKLRRTIVAPNAIVPADLRIGSDDDEDARWFRIAPGGTRLVTAAMLAQRDADLRNERPAQRYQSQLARA